MENVTVYSCSSPQHCQEINGLGAFCAVLERHQAPPARKDGPRGALSGITKTSGCEKQNAVKSKLLTAFCHKLGKLEVNYL
jgi:hypothetical protein